MRTLLAAVAVIVIAAAYAPHAWADALQSKTPNSYPSSSNFKIPALPQFKSELRLQDGMIAQKEVAPNAKIGLGLAPMLGRNIHSVRIEQEPVESDNPGVMFVLKFPG